MTDTALITFKKKRELGEIISDTFAFLRSQIKPFSTVYLKIVGPYLALFLVSFILYSWYVGDLVNERFDTDFNGGFGPIQVLIAMFYGISILVFYTISQSTILHYIKSYTVGKGTTSLQHIRTNVHDTFFVLYWDDFYSSALFGSRYCGVLYSWYLSLGSAIANL